MSLTPGTRLGHYEIAIGPRAGGPPPLARFSRELWRGLAEAQQRPR